MGLLLTDGTVGFSESHKRTFPCRFVCFWCESPLWARDSWFTSLLDHTQRRTTVGRTPLDEWSARRRDLYTDNPQHSRQTTRPLVRLEPTISARALVRADTGIGFPCRFVLDKQFQCYYWNCIWETFTRNWKWMKGATSQQPPIFTIFFFNKTCLPMVAHPFLHYDKKRLR
jgi:hypothetical protein